MVTLFLKTRLRGRAFVMMDVVIAISILGMAMLPMSFGIIRERQVVRASYYRAVAIEIVDGEMEVLRKGEGRAFAEGVHAYTVRAEAAKNLPPGKFVLTRSGMSIKLEWLPENPQRSGRVWREATLE